MGRFGTYVTAWRLDIRKYKLTRYYHSKSQQTLARSRYVGAIEAQVTENCTLPCLRPGFMKMHQLEGKMLATRRPRCAKPFGKNSRHVQRRVHGGSGLKESGRKHQLPCSSSQFLCDPLMICDTYTWV